MKKITSQKCKVIALESYFKVGKCNIASLSNTRQLHLLKEDTRIQRYNYSPYTFLYPNSLIINRFT